MDPEVNRMSKRAWITRRKMLKLVTVRFVQVLRGLFLLDITSSSSVGDIVVNTTSFRVVIPTMMLAEFRSGW